jgi:hypothetical protein
MEQKYPNTKAMAAQLGICVRTLRRWVREEIVPVIPINSRTWRFDVSAIHEALKARSGLEQPGKADKIKNGAPCCETLTRRKERE